MTKRLLNARCEDEKQYVLLNLSRVNAMLLKESWNLSELDR